MSKELSFSFKGDRDYVHGTDIFNSCMSFIDKACMSGIELKFSGVVTKNLIISEGDGRADAKVDVCVKTDGAHKFYQLYESDTPVTGRYDYDEARITQLCDLDLTLQQVALRESTPYSACENLVAMHKFLLQALFPEEKGKWYFTRLELNSLISDTLLLRVKLVKNFNFRLVKSHIFDGDRLLGSVYFTLVRS